jgi:hypothetical protein
LFSIARFPYRLISPPALNGTARRLEFGDDPVTGGESAAAEEIGRAEKRWPGEGANMSYSIDPSRNVYAARNHEFIAHKPKKNALSENDMRTADYGFGNEVDTEATQLWRRENDRQEEYKVCVCRTVGAVKHRVADLTLRLPPDTPKVGGLAPLADKSLRQNNDEIFLEMGYQADGVVAAVSQVLRNLDEPTMTDGTKSWQDLTPWQAVTVECRYAYEISKKDKILIDNYKADFCGLEQTLKANTVLSDDRKCMIALFVMSLVAEADRCIREHRPDGIGYLYQKFYDRCVEIGVQIPFTQSPEIAKHVVELNVIRERSAARFNKQPVGAMEDDLATALAKDEYKDWIVKNDTDNESGSVVSNYNSQAAKKIPVLQRQHSIDRQQQQNGILAVETENGRQEKLPFVTSELEEDNLHTPEIPQRVPQSEISELDLNKDNILASNSSIHNASGTVIEHPDSIFQDDTSTVSSDNSAPTPTNALNRIFQFSNGANGYRNAASLELQITPDQKTAHRSKSEGNITINNAKTPAKQILSIQISDNAESDNAEDEKSNEWVGPVPSSARTNASTQSNATIATIAAISVHARCKAASASPNSRTSIDGALIQSPKIAYLSVANNADKLLETINDGQVVSDEQINKLTQDVMAVDPKEDHTVLAAITANRSGDPASDADVPDERILETFATAIMCRALGSLIIRENFLRRMANEAKNTLNENPNVAYDKFSEAYNKMSDAEIERQLSIRMKIRSYKTLREANMLRIENAVSESNATWSKSEVDHYLLKLVLGMKTLNPEDECEEIIEIWPRIANYVTDEHFVDIFKLTDANKDETLSFAAKWAAASKEINARHDAIQFADINVDPVILHG